MPRDIAIILMVIHQIVAYGLVSASIFALASCSIDLPTGQGVSLPSVYLHIKSLAETMVLWVQRSRCRSYHSWSSVQAKAYLR